MDVYNMGLQNYGRIVSYRSYRKGFQIYRIGTTCIVKVLKKHILGCSKRYFMV